MRPNRLLNLLKCNARRGEFRAEANTIYLYDVIASDDMDADLFGGISARGFVSALDAMTGPVTLRINSPGGDVFAGWAMAQAVREYEASKGEVTAVVDGVAASAASVVATAAKRTVMARSSMLMIHKAWSMVIGNSGDMLETAALLEKVDGVLAAAYAARTGGDADEFMRLMDAETWFTPDEAVAARLADGIADEAGAVSAKWDLSAYGNAPVAVIAAPEQPDISDDEIASRVRRHAARMLENAA